jgi:hypothetical protein
MGLFKPLTMKRNHMKPSPLKDLLYPLIVGAVLVFASGFDHTGAKAADGAGNFAIRGVGSLFCSEFVQSVETDEEARIAYAEWVSGYLTALNRGEENTFDISYVASNLEVTALLGRVCSTRPEVRVEAALSGLTDLMRTSRVEKETELVRLSLGETSIMVRQSILDQFMQKLVEDGYLDAPRTFDNTARDAVVAFQQANNLPVSGLPDFNTLIRAFSAED